MRLLALFAFALLMESATAQHGASASNIVDRAHTGTHILQFQR